MINAKEYAGDNTPLIFPPQGIYVQVEALNQTQAMLPDEITVSTQNLNELECISPNNTKEGGCKTGSLTLTNNSTEGAVFMIKTEYGQRHYLKPGDHYSLEGYHRVLTECNRGMSINDTYRYAQEPDLKLTDYGVIVSNTKCVGDKQSGIDTQNSGNHFSANYTVGTNQYSFGGQTGPNLLVRIPQGFNYTYSPLNNSPVDHDAAYFSYVPEGTYLGDNLLEGEPFSVRIDRIHNTVTIIADGYPASTYPLPPQAEIILYTVTPTYHTEDGSYGYHYLPVIDSGRYGTTTEHLFGRNHMFGLYLIADHTDEDNLTSVGLCTSYLSFHSNNETAGTQLALKRSVTQQPAAYKLTNTNFIEINSISVTVDSQTYYTDQGQTALNFELITDQYSLPIQHKEYKYQFTSLFATLYSTKAHGMLGLAFGKMAGVNELGAYGITRKLPVDEQHESHLAFGLNYQHVPNLIPNFTLNQEISFDAAPTASLGIYTTGPNDFNIRRQAYKTCFDFNQKFYNSPGLMPHYLPLIDPSTGGGENRGQYKMNTDGETYTTDTASNFSRRYDGMGQYQGHNGYVNQQRYLINCHINDQILTDSILETGKHNTDISNTPNVAACVLMHIPRKHMPLYLSMFGDVVIDNASEGIQITNDPIIALMNESGTKYPCQSDTISDQIYGTTIMYLCTQSQKYIPFTVDTSNIPDNLTVNTDIYYLQCMDQ